MGKSAKHAVTLSLKRSINKKVALVLVLTGLVALCTVTIKPAFLIGVSSVKALTENVATTLFVSLEPNTAEVDQLVQVNIRLRIEPASPDEPFHQAFEKIVVTLIRPDGFTIREGTYDISADGIGDFSYSLWPGLAGNWTYKVSFPGQAFADGAIYYLPAEAQATLSVSPPSPPPWSTAGSWTQKASMHQARSVLGVVAVNGKIYAIGGSTASGFAPSIPPSAAYGDINIDGVVGTNEEYDPVKDTWSYKARMPTPRIAFAIAAYQGKIHCIGGRTSDGYTSVNEVYDPATDMWEAKASMPTAVGWLTANVVNGKIYVMDYSGTNYVYDPAANSWSTKAPVPAAAFDGYASAVLDKKIYVIGGLSKNYDGNLNLIYDTETDTWSFGTPPPSSHGGGAAGATTGETASKRIYVLGEIANLRQGEEQTFVRVYDPASDSWSFGADAPTSRYNFGVAVVNDMLYAIGGHTYNFPGNFVPTAVNEQYTPVGYGTLQAELVYVAVAGAAAITIVAITAVALKKRHQKKHKFS